jgi:hypothetical protein
MDFSEVKKSILDDLLSRDLKNPSIRLNAIDSVETLLKLKIQEMLSNSIKLIELLGKNELKNLLSELKKNERINDAESSIIINEIYYRINSKKNSR